jgi:hypothetical protein
MDQSETVTLFNDMWLLAPSTLLDANIVWEELDRHSLRATFTNRGKQVRAELLFDDNGDLASFSSRDRYQSADGKTYTQYPWVTPVLEYGCFGGQRVVRRAEAIWKEPGGDYVYGRFLLEAIEYNLAASARQPPTSTGCAAS